VLQPELQLNFSRGPEELTLELRHDIATAEFLVITHRFDAGGAATDNVDRFGDVDQAMAYLHFVEGRLGDDEWIRTEAESTAAEAVEAVEAQDTVAIEEDPEEPAPTLDPLPPFFPAEIDSTFPEESPFSAESRFDSQEIDQPALSETEPAAPFPADPSAVPNPADGELGGASYSLERPLYCPHCREWIRTILVVRLSRMQVRFTSTLPRSGRALACSACHGVLSLELSGFV
jgi:hypothetical protein